MPITSFADISLSQIFQELPSLVSLYGLFAEVFGYGNLPDDAHIGSITLKITTYKHETKGLLTESRLLRKMQHLPPCEIPCTYCIPSAEGEAERCPMCLDLCPHPPWTKGTSVAKITVTPTGQLIIDSQYAEILHSFLAPLFRKQVIRYEEHIENIIRVSEEYEKNKMKRRKLRQAEMEV
jgi:hypothetical protein